MSYKILQDGYFEIETNTSIPDNKNNRHYQKMIQELEDRDLASYDSRGNYIFYPDEIFLFAADPVVGITLDDIKKAAHQEIDKAAGRARLKYITSVAGQAETYQLKAADAKAYKAAGYPKITGSNFMMVKAEAEALGVTPKEAAELIRITEVNWIQLAALIEKERRMGKIKVSNAPTEAAINTIKEDTITKLGTL